MMSQVSAWIKSLWQEKLSFLFLSGISSAFVFIPVADMEKDS